MGTLTIADKYAVAQFSYEDGNVVLSGNARYNKDGLLVNVDSGQATKDGNNVGTWYAYRDGDKMKLNVNNFETTDLVVVLPIIQECLAALEAEE